MQILEILGKVGFDWQVALANLVNFLIIFWVLKKFVFQTIADTIEKRRAVIAKGLKEREQAGEELNRAEAEREKVLNEAKKEARLIVESAKEQESSIVSKAKGQAETEAEKLINRAQKEIEVEKEKARSQLKNSAAELVSSAVKKIIEEEISRDKAEKFVQGLIAKQK